MDACTQHDMKPLHGLREHQMNFSIDLLSGQFLDGKIIFVDVCCGCGHGT